MLISVSFCILEMRVDWFRARAIRDRWCEEAELLEEELRRLARGFEYMRKVWGQLAAEALEQHCSANAAFASGKEATYLALADNAHEYMGKLCVSEYYKPLLD